ncbi:ABC transporter ATP-binding protein [Paenibacillus sp. GCM10023252]|uniref:ABC transporter ATP-binding protein n=1 Tax=Paenibacillus sp. GCM10023252 TaxID=3252649 RepID=UPI003608B14F
MLILDHITKSFGKTTVLHPLSIQIENGMFGLLGPNGAGKTTLMRILTTILEPTSGRVQYGSVHWGDKDKARQLIGYLPQKFSFYSNSKVVELLEHIAVLKGVEAPKESVQKVIKEVNLEEHSHKKMGNLSGGMVRRVGIAQALLGKPRIIIVDEPTAGLDPEERIRFRKLLKSMGKNSVVIISTHIVEDIEATCDHCAILYNGKILKSGSISEISSLAEGKVWGQVIDRDNYYNLDENAGIIASHAEGDQYRLRILASECPKNGTPLKSNLEDSYLYAMRNLEL